MPAVHRADRRVQPYTVPQIIAAVPIGDVATREAIRVNDPELMRKRVKELVPCTTLGAMRAAWALLVALADAAGDVRMVSLYCHCAAEDLDGAA